ncbi:MAG: adaptor protein MecA [Oscillospiraceae bacterium]|nr:adaptor protein MecA [Oscillospiraceae bacterium]
MKYDSLSRDTVKITLSEEDMKEYSLCAEAIMLRTAEARRSLSKMLRKMKLFSGYKPDRLFLEAFPEEDGGCILYVSVLHEESESENNCETALMCCLMSLDDLSLLCRVIESAELEVKTCVYHSPGGYILVSLADKDEYFALRHIFSEFGRVCTDISEISTISEYAAPVCLSNACSIFAKLY